MIRSHPSTWTEEFSYGCLDEEFDDEVNNEKVFDILMDARSPYPTTSYGDMDDHISPIIPDADESEDINFLLWMTTRILVHPN